MKAFSLCCIIVGSFIVMNAVLSKKSVKISTFYGKRVLITGASSGLGRALAIDLSSRGAKCVLIAIDQKGLDETASMCKDPQHHTLIYADLSQVYDVDRVISYLKDQEFEFYALCAGLGSSGISAPVGKIFSLFAVNCSACAAFATTVKARRTLLMASPYAFLPLPNRALYAASKAACLYLARCLTVDGIDCLVAMPMWFYSNLRANAIGVTYDTPRKAAKGARTAESVASEIIYAAMVGDREVCLDMKYRVGRLFYAVFPGIVEFAVRRFVSGNQ